MPISGKFETGLSAPSTFIDSTLSTPPELGNLAQMVGILMSLRMEFQQGDRLPLGRMKFKHDLLVQFSNTRLKRAAAFELRFPTT